MISTARILFHSPNTRTLKSIIKVDVSGMSVEKCEELIRSGGYSIAYDLNGDGYLDATDYNLLYDKLYGKWEFWESGQGYLPTGFDIRCLVRIKKIIAGLQEPQSDLDLDGDGFITEADLTIARKWLLNGIPERATFN